MCVGGGGSCCPTADTILNLFLYQLCTNAEYSRLRLAESDDTGRSTVHAFVAQPTATGRRCFTGSAAPVPSAEQRNSTQMVRSTATFLCKRQRTDEFLYLYVAFCKPSVLWSVQKKRTIPPNRAPMRGALSSMQKGVFLVLHSCEAILNIMRGIIVVS